MSGKFQVYSGILFHLRIEDPTTCHTIHSLVDITLRQIKNYLIITHVSGTLKLNLQRWIISYGGKGSRSRERDVLLWYELEVLSQKAHVWKA